VRTKPNLPIHLALPTSLSVLIHYPLAIIPVFALTAFTHYYSPLAGGDKMYRGKTTPSEQILLM